MIDQPDILAGLIADFAAAGEVDAPREGFDGRV